MKILLKILGGLASLILLLVGIAFLFPREYRVERSTVIKASAETVHAQLADMRAWRAWTVWHERDPAMTNTYSENQGVIGAWTAWDSKTEGKGRSTLTEISSRRIAYDLEFPDMGMKSRGVFELQPEGDAVRVTWSDSGDLGMNPVNRWFGLFLDGMLGPDFEAGLAKLKRNLEK